MASFEKIIPFIFHFAAGVPSRCLSLPLHRQFEIARLTGWSDDPDDTGGATMIDITLNTYSAHRRRKGLPPATKQNLRNITFEEWSEILKRDFWDLWRADDIEYAGIAHLLVDWVWASGPSSIPIAQKCIGVKPDGIPGPLTLRAINSSDAAALFGKLYARRRAYYRSCRGAWKYLRGWMRRLDAIRPDGSFNL